MRIRAAFCGLFGILKGMTPTGSDGGASVRSRRHGKGTGKGFIRVLDRVDGTGTELGMLL